MHIVVPIKQVPESEELRYDPATRTLVREGVTSVINPYDKRSLTEAVRLRALYGGSITAVTMGPPQAREALVECLGRGVDRVVHISDPALAASDTLVTARTLAAALRRLDFDLLLFGLESTDSETGQVGPEVAEILGLPQVIGATAIELRDNGMLGVTRETDLGFEWVICPLPAVLAAAERLIKPVKTKPPLIEEGQRRISEDPSLIETLSISDLGLRPEEVGLSGSPTWVSELRPVEIDRERTLLSGDPVSLAKSLLLALRERGLDALPARERNSLPPLPTPTREPDPARAVWAVAERLRSPEGGEPGLRKVSLELAGEAARIASLVGGDAVGVLIGYGVEPLAEELARAGVDAVLLADAPELEPYNVETYAWALARAIEEHKPWAVLLPATSFGRDLAPRVAARLGLGLTADCLGLEVDGEGRLLQLKPAFGGQVVAPILSHTLPALVTVRPGMVGRYAPDASRRARVLPLEIRGRDLPRPRVRVERATAEGEGGLALDDARLVVCVGMGIGGPESLPEVDRLAQALGRWMGLSPGEVAIGGTRKVVDEGWLPGQQQIGITGRAVAPDLYLGLGVGGSFNHMVGILGSGTIVAANTNPEAPILQAVDLGVLCDWRSLAEALLGVLGGPD
ncbi:MAG: FAD-binding protein [Chloroflexia bacterium]